MLHTTNVEPPIGRLLPYQEVFIFCLQKVLAMADAMQLVLDAGQVVLTDGESTGQRLWPQSCAATPT